MLKGVNRQVVEICEPESSYFERVLFFVKPEFYGLGESKLKHKADELINTSVKLPKMREKAPRKKHIINFLKLAASAFTGAFLTLLLLLMTR